MRQTGEIKGFARAMWNGITTFLLAQNIDKIIESNLVGLYQLAPNYKISKYHLLRKIARIFNKKIVIKPDYKFKQDKTLIPSYRKNFTPIMPKNYEEMLIEMKKFIERSKNEI